MEVRLNLAGLNREVVDSVSETIVGINCEIFRFSRAISENKIHIAEESARNVFHKLEVFELVRCHNLLETAGKWIELVALICALTACLILRSGCPSHYARSACYTSIGIGFLGVIYPLCYKLLAWWRGNSYDRRLGKFLQLVLSDSESERSISLSVVGGDLWEE